MRDSSWPKPKGGARSARVSNFGCRAREWGEEWDGGRDKGGVRLGWRERQGSGAARGCLAEAEGDGEDGQSFGKDPKDWSLRPLLRGKRAPRVEISSTVFGVTASGLRPTARQGLGRTWPKEKARMAWRL